MVFRGVAGLCDNLTTSTTCTTLAPYHFYHLTTGTVQTQPYDLYHRTTFTVLPIVVCLQPYHLYHHSTFPQALQPLHSPPPYHPTLHLRTVSPYHLHQITTIPLHHLFSLLQPFHHFLQLYHSTTVRT